MSLSVLPSAACLAFVFAIGASPAMAQGGPPPGGPGAAASLAARLDALEARVAALDTGNAALAARVTAIETVDVDDIPGTYKFVLLGIELNRGFPGTPNVPARVNSETGKPCSR